ncbi:MAG: SDR family NAD(P)-dependent oxidoreductase [Thermoanaerobaculia bacterium]
MSLEGKGAVVTGGGRGIGAAVAGALARSGARVVVAARSPEETAAVAGELTAAGHAAWAVRCDVRDAEAVESLRSVAEEYLGQIDVLVNNAGTASSAPLPKIALDEWQRLFEVNATGTFLCTRAFLPAMAERGWGRVVNIASVAGLRGAPYIAAYCAAKHAVVGFTRAVAVEYAQRGVTVNAICPGYVDTPMTEASIANIVEKTGRSADEARRLLERQSPQNRLMTPEEVAWLTVALCGEEARGVNGQAIALDGGAVQA